MSGLTRGVFRWFSFSGKTFWDLLGIIAIPVVIAVVTMQFSAQQSETSTRIAQDQQQESVLQTYLDRMSDLLVKNALRESQPGDEVRSIARAHTLTVLSQLDGWQKARLVRFLQETGLIDRKNVVVSLRGANLYDMRGGLDLRDTDLSYANIANALLGGINLYNANLNNTDLYYAHLYYANLSCANLHGANLYGALLDHANLSYTNLRGANLYGADLSSTNLNGANLSNAYLHDAKLIGAKVNREQLNQAKSLKGAIMPDGSKHP